MTHITADTHVHVYPCHRLDEMLRCAWANMGAKDGMCLLFLTERADCSFFHDVRDGKVSMPDGWHAAAMCDENAFCLKRVDGQGSFCVIRGRQVVTKERLEVLALAGDPELTDGCEARQVIETILSDGAVPVLPWAPGKWLFERGRDVEALMRTFQPGQMLIGDTTLRPRGWIEPGLMREARSRGFKVVAGTDPLPFAGEERRVGQYGIAWQGDLGEYSLVRDIRRMLLDPICAVHTIGHRDGLVSVAQRLFKNRQAKRAAR